MKIRFYWFACFSREYYYLKKWMLCDHEISVNVLFKKMSYKDLEILIEIL
jgi:hypothetical protein